MVFSSFTFSGWQDQESTVSFVKASIATRGLRFRCGGSRIVRTGHLAFSYILSKSVPSMELLRQLLSPFAEDEHARRSYFVESIAPHNDGRRIPTFANTLDASQKSSEVLKSYSSQGRDARKLSFGSKLH